MIEKDVVLGENVKIHHPELVNLYGCTIGANTRIADFVEIGKGVIVGANCIIGKGAFLCEGVTLEDNVFIAPEVCFTNDLYPPNDRENWLPTLVKRGAVIGANATILCGITIGANAIIGAGSVVTKDIPKNGIAYGNPARIKERR